MREYTVNISGIPHTMLLSDQDAERFGAIPVDAPGRPKVKAAEPPANKSRQPANKA